MAKTTETIPANAVEMPPNKAIAAAGSSATSTGVGSIIVGLLLHYYAPDTPPEIVGLWNALAGVIFGFVTGVAVYYMPHGAIVKE